MKKLYLLLFTCLCFLFARAQKNGLVKGTAFDTLSKQPVVAATITVLQKKDAELVGFTMTDNKGQFELGGLVNGDYRLLITHVNYHNTSRYFTIDEANKQLNLGSLVMNDVHRVLGEVVVTAEAPPVTLIDDTVQYNAGSFKTAPNATVEQLLKKMPGLKVNKDGSIKAQGQDVKRVLVDGKEFFGTDPKLATRNLPADAVDKVQVYDKMSDQAQLTGFDDGNSEKTINLKLKKDKKKGMFGKAAAGAGTNERYEGRFNVNSFKGARQLSVIGMGNNTNAEGFSFMDMLNFTGGMNNQKPSGDGLQINIVKPDDNSNNNNNSDGIKTIWAGGVNYNNIIGNKTNFTSNYFYNRYSPKTESVIQRQYFLPDSSYYYNQYALNKNLNNSHKLNLSADIQIDSFHSVKISPSFGYQQTQNATISNYATQSPEMRPGTNGVTDNESNNHGFNFRNDLLFRKKFRQRGRTFSLSLQNNINGSDGDGSLLSANTYRNTAGTVLRTDSINQRNISSSDLNSYTARLVYTEPIFKRSLLEFSVGKSNSKTTSQKLTYDYNALTKYYDRKNELLSSDYESSYGYNMTGIKWRMQQRKFNASAGINWQNADLEGTIISQLKDSVINKSFYNLLPNARIQYSFTKYRTLRLNYSTSTNQPTISQLQPVPDISDPLNIRAGNADLKQEFTHTVQLNFFSVNPFKNKNLFAFANLRRTDNKIVDYDTIDSVGVKTTKPVNVNGVYDVSGDVNLGLPVRFLNGSVNIGTNVSYTKNKSFINAVMNSINSVTVAPDIRFDISAGSKLDLSLNAGISYYSSKYSLQPALNTEYFDQHYGMEVNWQWPHNFYFNTEFTYTINSQRANGFNSKVLLWNGYISKQFLHFNRGELKLYAFDWLNQNIGVSRNSNQNYIEDKRYITLQRYFMLSFTYSLSKNGLSAGKGEQGIHIIRK